MYIQFTLYERIKLKLLTIRVWTLKIVQAIYFSFHVTSEGIFNNMN